MAMMKKLLEETVESACACGKGDTLEITDHDKSCPAYRILQECGLDPLEIILMPKSNRGM